MVTIRASSRIPADTSKARRTRWRAHAGRRRPAAARLRRAAPVAGPGRGGRGGSSLAADAIRHGGPGHAAKQRESDRAADLLTSVEQARGSPGRGGLDARQGDQGQRHEQHAQPGAGHERRTEQPGGVVAVLPDPGQPEHPAGRGHRAGEQQGPGADPGDQLGAGAGHRHDGGHHRQVGHTGPQRGFWPACSLSQGTPADGFGETAVTDTLAVAAHVIDAAGGI